MFNCCSHGTLLHISLQGSHLNTCYYHQDLHTRQLHPVLRPWLLCLPRRPPTCQGILAEGLLALTVLYRSVAPAPSIFRAGWFGRWVVTHSLADSNFHGHRPAVYINQHLLWSLMSVMLGTLTATFGSSRIASSAYQKWPTGHSHSVSTHLQLREMSSSPISSLRISWGHFAPNTSNHSLYRMKLFIRKCQLSWGKLRGEPATRWFD